MPVIEPLPEDQIEEKGFRKILGRCEEVAWAVAYLASEAGDYVTGTVFTVDGGKNLWGSWWPVPDPPDMEPVEIPGEPWE